ncbi:MAG: hypothetical protein QM791_19095 [Ferruginibacter sp.]
MKSRIFGGLTIIFLLCFCQSAHARIWRVNNKSNYDGATLWGDNLGGTAAYPIFKEVNQAVAFGIVNNGDTLHIEGSTSVYQPATITKRLVLIGAGFFLTQNPNTAANTMDSKIEQVAFNTGSTGSYAIALNVVNNGNVADGIIYVGVNSITVKRCRIERYVWFQTLLQNVTVIENFFPSTFNTNCISTNGNVAFVPPTDIIFNNNICQKILTWGSPLANPTTFWPILQCRNNVFDGPDNLATPNLAFSTSEFSNNILMPTNAVVNIQASSGVVRNNIGTLSTQFGTTDNNLVVPAITSLFVTSASTDGAYQIQSGSLANNNGTDGTDRGAFGGAAVTSRYTLSGLAPIPVIYEITTIGVADASGLPVTIKARTIK